MFNARFSRFLPLVLLAVLLAVSAVSVGAQTNDEAQFNERCRALGLTLEQCRIYFSLPDRFIDLCKERNLSALECVRLWLQGSNTDNSDTLPPTTDNTDNALPVCPVNAVAPDAPRPCRPHPCASAAARPCLPPAPEPSPHAGRNIPNPSDVPPVNNPDSTSPSDTGENQPPVRPDDTRPDPARPDANTPPVRPGNANGNG